MIRGLIFDFDGLILNTEVPEYRAWEEIYTAHGADLPFSVWTACVGGGPDLFDPVQYLEDAIGRKIADRDALRAQQRGRSISMTHGEPLLPGVMEYLEVARRMGLRTAIASSSTREWVLGYVEPRGLVPYFDAIVTSDLVAQAKPAPDLYLTALDMLGLEATQAVAFEDSHNGVVAAKAAGIYCVAVPNEITQGMDFSIADRILPSLAELPLSDLLAQLSGNGKNGKGAA